MKIGWLTPPGREEILGGAALRTMFRIGAPAVLSSVLFTLYNLTDAFFIGLLPGGTPQAVMAGIQISWPFVWFLVSFIGGFGGAVVTALVAQNVGANRPDEANLALNQMVHGRRRRERRSRRRRIRLHAVHSGRVRPRARGHPPGVALHARHLPRTSDDDDPAALLRRAAGDRRHPDAAPVHAGRRAAQYPA